MIIWIGALIALVALVGGFLLEYQKNKMEMLERNRHNEQEVDDVRKLVNSLKTRIENLEAIAAGEPDEFKTGAGKGMEEIEIDEDSITQENREQVSNIANKQRNK